MRRSKNRLLIENSCLRKTINWTNKIQANFIENLKFSLIIWIWLVYLAERLTSVLRSLDRTKDNSSEWYAHGRRVWSSQGDKPVCLSSAIVWNLVGGPRTSLAPDFVWKHLPFGNSSPWLEMRSIHPFHFMYVRLNYSVLELYSLTRFRCTDSFLTYKLLAVCYCTAHLGPTWIGEFFIQFYF